MAAEHHFECDGVWHGNLMQGSGEVSAGALKHPVSVPGAMGGPGRGSNPEEMLVAAANSCYLMTLAALLQFEGIAYVALRNRSRATFASTPTGPVMTALRHEPVVQLTPEARMLFGGSVQGCFLQAERGCMVSKAIANNVTVAVQGVVEALRAA